MTMPTASGSPSSIFSPGDLSGERIREIHPLADDQGKVYLIYDLERTFIIPVPEPFGTRVAPFIEEQGGDEALRSWLREEGLLTSESRTPFSENPSTLPQVTDISLDMSGACNMGCGYCFESAINSRIGSMDLDVALQTLSWAFEKAGPSKKLVLHFGSGEPLLHFELLKTLVREAQKRSAQQGIRLFFELTTNGTLVTQEIARFLAQNNFIVRVSCDGPAHLHNLNRPLKSGQGSYEDVIKGLNHLLDHMADRVTVNSVLTSGNRLIELWEWAKALNILHYHVIKVGAEPENSVNLPSRDLISFREDLEMITQEMFEELEMGRSPMDYQPITKLVRRLMIPLPITRFCGVSGTYLGVASDGKVYPCFRHLGMTEYELGNIFNGIDDEKRKEFLSNEGAEVDHRPVCQTCWGRYLCGGGCYADSTVYGPEKLEPQTHHCPFWKAEIETALRFYSKLLKTKPSHCFLLFKDNPATLFETEDSFLNFLEQESCS